MKKLMSWLLALCLVVGMVPMTALAADSSTAAWDGTVDTTWYNGNDTTFTIEDAADLAGLAQLVNQGNTFEKKTIKLGADIDLGDKEWMPIGTSSNPFKGTFDGAKEDGSSYTISNLLINKPGMRDVGLFGFTSAGEVKNFTLNNAKVTGYLDVGAVAGTPYTSKYSNISVTGLIQVNGFSYVGGALGKNAYANITNVDVTGDEGSYVKADSVEGNQAYRTYVGGLVGFMGEGSHVVQDCDVKIDVTGSTCDVGGILGILHYGNTLTNCTYEGSLTLTDPDKEDGVDFGALVGVVHTNSTNDTTISNCTATVTKAMSGTEDVTNTITPHGAFYRGSANTSKVSISATINGTPVTVYNYEAQIGGTRYKTLTEAVQNAESGAVIQILQDVTLSSTISVKKTLTFEGVTKSDGTKPVIRSSQGSGIFSQSGDAVYTLKNLELQISNDGQWYIYHSANTLTIDHCDFTMPDGVKNTGNVVMGEGEPKDDGDYALIFTNNTIKANSRAAITGIGNGSVVTGNEIDLIDEAYGGDEESRTSVISITAIDGGDGVTITDNTFKNSNRAIAVDNSTLKAENLVIQNNKFIDVRYAFELSPTKNETCGTYDLNKNYFEFDGVVSAPKIENADSTGDHFETGEGSTEYLPADGEADLVENDEYYIKDTMRPEDLNTYVPTITVYDNTVATTTNGAATVTDVKKGATATITTTPDKGYKVGSVTVLDNSGKAVTVTNIGDGKYTFTQPTGGVTVTVIFVWDNPFTDVGEAWYTEAIQYVYQNGLMAGTGATTFEPNTQLTRAMAVQILYNVEGKPSVTGEATFTDAAAAGDWAVDAITWAEQNGVVAGMGNGTFAPNAKVTREQFAQMMYNYAEYKDYDLTKTGNLAQFSDEGDVSSWAETALKWANGNGLINGHDDGTLEPQGTAIRAQAASILMNFDLTFVK